MWDLPRSGIEPIVNGIITHFIFIGRTEAEAQSPILWPPDWEKPTHWKRPRCWERLRARGEGGKRWWDDWMASLTQWTWFWANSWRQWRTGKPSVLQSMGLQRIRHYCSTEKQFVIYMYGPIWKISLIESCLSFYVFTSFSFPTLCLSLLMRKLHVWFLLSLGGMVFISEIIN